MKFPEELLAKGRPALDRGRFAPTDKLYIRFPKIEWDDEADLPDFTKIKANHSFKAHWL